MPYADPEKAKEWRKNYRKKNIVQIKKNMKKTNASIRYSEFEEIKRKKYIFKYLKWIWIDHFTKFSLGINFYNFLKKNYVKICLVSPVLVIKK